MQSANLTGSSSIRLNATSPLPLQTHPSMPLQSGHHNQSPMQIIIFHTSVNIWQHSPSLTMEPPLLYKFLMRVWQFFGKGASYWNHPHTLSRLTGPQASNLNGSLCPTPTNDTRRKNTPTEAPKTSIYRSITAIPRLRSCMDILSVFPIFYEQ